MDTIKEGHGGGDEGIMKAFLEMIRENKKPEGETCAMSAILSHEVAFAAEEARLTNTVVQMNN